MAFKKEPVSGIDLTISVIDMLSRSYILPRQKHPYLNLAITRLTSRRFANRRYAAATATTVQSFCGTRSCVPETLVTGVTPSP